MKTSTKSSTARKPIFVDTSGFYALFIDDDRHHPRARSILVEAEKYKRLFVTTDYIVDETATLFRARKQTAAISLFFQILQSTKACRLVWMDTDRFDAAQKLFLRHSDKNWSFTDCTSFSVMRELGLTEALTSDHHFEQAQFVPLL